MDNNIDLFNLLKSHNPCEWLDKVQDGFCQMNDEITSLRESLKLAVEALQKSIRIIESDSVPNECDGGETHVLVPDKLEKLLHEALATIKAKGGL